MRLFSFPFSHPFFESVPTLAALADALTYLPSHCSSFALIVSLHGRVVSAPGQNLEQANLESLSQGGSRGAGVRTLKGSSRPKRAQA